MNSKGLKDNSSKSSLKSAPPSTLLASFSLSSPRVPKKIVEKDLPKAVVLATGSSSSSLKQSTAALPWYAVDEEVVSEQEEESAVVDPKQSNETEEVSEDAEIFLSSALNTLLSQSVLSLVTSTYEGAEDDVSISSSRPIGESSTYVDSSDTPSPPGLTQQPHQPIDLSYFYPRGYSPQLQSSVTINSLDKSLFPSLGPLRRRVRALWIAEAALDNDDNISLWDGLDLPDTQSSLSLPSNLNSSFVSSVSTTTFTFSHRGVESIVTRPVHPAPTPMHIHPVVISPPKTAVLGVVPPPFSSRSLALAMSSLAPVELATCLEIKESINSSLRQDLRSVQKSYMDALKELDPQQQEAEMGLLSLSTSVSSSSNKSPRCLSDDALRSLAATARHDVVVFTDTAPQIVETNATSSLLASLAEALYSELRRRASFEVSSLEQLSDELKLLTPSLEQLIADMRTSLKHVDESLKTYSTSFSSVAETAAELNEWEDSMKREEELLEVWESRLSVSDSSAAVASDIITSTSRLELVPTPRKTQAPSLPHYLLDHIALAEEDERRAVTNLFNNKLADIRSDIEARIGVIRNGEMERIEATAREVENDLSSSFDAQMALITAREKAAEKTVSDLTSRLSAISSELVSVRTLKRLRGQVRRMWAVSQPDRLCLALDCDSEGWNDDEKDDDDEIAGIQAIDTSSTNVKHSKEIAEADAIVQLRKNERSAAVSAVSESALRIEAEKKRLRRARISPLVSLGLFGGSRRNDTETKSEKIVSNSNFRQSDTLPILNSHSPLDTDTFDGYIVDVSLPTEFRDENQAAFKALDDSPVAQSALLATKALLVAENKLAEAEKVSQYLRIRHERRAAALMLRRNQRHQRAAASLLAKGVTEAESEAVKVTFEKEESVSKTVIMTPLINTSTSIAAFDAKKKSEQRTELLKWRESVRKLTHEQRMRNAICRFLTQAVRAVPYDPDYAVVLTVAQKVGQRLLKKLESTKGMLGSVNVNVNDSSSSYPVINDMRQGSSSFSLLEVIHRIVTSAKEKVERKVSKGAGEV